MRDFFSGQLDYIYFFYGLSFIILSGVCFTLLKRPSQKHIPYRWLCLFALVHGVHEWLEVVAINIGDHPAFLWIRVSLLILSFSFLFEFARVGISRLYNRAISAWIYLPASILVALGSFVGPEGMNVASRYVLGLWGGVGTAWVLYRYSYSENVGKTALRRAGMAFAIYSLATGLITPAADFFPANMINRDMFFSAFGFPVQLLRGLAALTTAIAIWVFSEKHIKQDFDRQRYFAIHSKVVDYAAVILLLFLIAGWDFTQNFGSLARQKVVDDGQAKIALLESYLEEELSNLKRWPFVLSGSPWIWPAFVARSAEDIVKANNVLDRYNSALDAAVTYLMDREGVVLASSNRNKPDSFVGKNYSFRPYFRRAMSGAMGTYFALGATSGERGYYVSAPVRAPDGQIVGVAVTKKSLSYLERQLAGYPYAFLADPHGIIFLSSQPRFTLKSLWPLDPRDETNIIRSKQFSAKTFQALFPARIDPGQIISFEKKKFYVNQLQIQEEGWSIVLLQPAGLIAQYRLFAESVVLVLCLLVIIAVVLLKQKEYYMAAVLAAESQRKDILDAAVQVAVIATDADGTVSVFNTGAERMLGYKTEEVVGKFKEEGFHLRQEVERYGEELAAQLGGAVKGAKRLVDLVRMGVLKSRQWTFVRKDGSTLWCEVAYSAMHDLEGNFTGFLQVVNDITERRKAEQQVAELLDLNQKVFSSSAVGILVYKASGACIAANEAASRIINASVSQLLEQDFLQLQSWRSVGMTVVAQEVVRTGSTRRGEFHFVTTFGKEVWLDCFFTTFQRKDDTCLLLLINDVTDRKIIEQELRDSRNYLSEIIDTVADPIFVKDREHRWVVLNSAFCGLMGHSRDELIGKTDHDFFPKEEAEVFWAKDEEAFTTGRENINEEAFTDRNGVTHTIMTKKEIYVNPQGEKFIVGIIRDISDHKQAELAMKKAVGLREEFTSMVSHELRTPLGPIKEGVSIILDGVTGEINEEQRDLLSMVRRNAERLNRLINNVLDFQKLESGKMPYDIREHDLAETILEAHKGMALVAKDRGIAFPVEIEPGLPKISFDRDKIIQVLNNLLNNALKFTENGSVRVTAKKDGNVIRVSVADTGPGIQAEDIPKLFRSFQQLDSAREKRFGGTGLGLAISKEIIRQHKGQIWVESEFGRGSVFHFVLPVTERRARDG